MEKKITDYLILSFLESVFRLHTVKLKAEALKFPRFLKNVFVKLSFRERLVWTVFLTVEMMLRGQIPPT